MSVHLQSKNLPIVNQKVLNEIKLALESKLEELVVSLDLNLSESHAKDIKRLLKNY